MSPERLAEKIRKCLALASDPRGDPHTAATARRQAEALIRERDAGLAAAAPIDWSTRSAAEAKAAGLEYRVLTREGWFVPATRD